MKVSFIFGIKAFGRIIRLSLVIAGLVFTSSTLESMTEPYIRTYSMIRVDASDKSEASGKKGPVLYNPMILSNVYNQQECFFWNKGCWTDPVNPDKFPGYHVSLGAFKITVPRLNDKNAPDYLKNIQNALYNATFEEVKKASLALNFDIIKTFKKNLSLALSAPDQNFVKLVLDIQNNVFQKLHAVLPAGFTIEYLYGMVEPHISLAYILDTPGITDTSHQKPIAGLSPFVFGGSGIRKLSLHATASLVKDSPQPRKFDLLQLVKQAIKCSTSVDHAIDRLLKDQILTKFTQNERVQALKTAMENNEARTVEVLKTAMSSAR